GVGGVGGVCEPVGVGGGGDDGGERLGGEREVERRAEHRVGVHVGVLLLDFDADGVPPVVLELVDAAGAGEGVEDGAFGDVVVLEDRPELVEQSPAVPGRVADATTQVWLGGLPLGLGGLPLGIGGLPLGLGGLPLGLPAGDALGPGLRVGDALGLDVLLDGPFDVVRGEVVPVLLVEGVEHGVVFAGGEQRLVVGLGLRLRCRAGGRVGAAVQRPHPVGYWGVRPNTLEVALHGALVDAEGAADGAQAMALGSEVGDDLAALFGVEVTAVWRPSSWFSTSRVCAGQGTASASAMRLR